MPKCNFILICLLISFTACNPNFENIEWVGTGSGDYIQDEETIVFNGGYEYRGDSRLCVVGSAWAERNVITGLTAESHLRDAARQLEVLELTEESCPGEEGDEVICPCFHKHHDPDQPLRKIYSVELPYGDYGYNEISLTLSSTLSAGFPFKVPAVVWEQVTSFEIEEVELPKYSELDNAFSNNSGQIAMSIWGDNERAALYTPGEDLLYIDEQAGFKEGYTIARALTEDGKVIGETAERVGREEQVFLYQPDRRLTLSRYPSRQARRTLVSGLNTNGIQVGSYMGSFTGFRRAYVRRWGRHYDDIGKRFFMNQSSKAVDVNRQGLVLGELGTHEAFVYDAGSFRTRPYMLPGFTSDSALFARTINDRNQIAGRVQNAAEKFVPVRWSRNDNPGLEYDLEELDTSSVCRGASEYVAGAAVAMNNAGAVLGSIRCKTSVGVREDHEFFVVLWKPDGRINAVFNRFDEECFDCDDFEGGEEEGDEGEEDNDDDHDDGDDGDECLPPYGWRNIVALDINDHFEIVARARYHGPTNCEDGGEGDQLIIIKPGSWAQYG